MTLFKSFAQYPLHLFHASKAPVIVHTADDEAQARSQGYADQYVPQEYPKHVCGKLANNAEEEAAIEAGYGDSNECGATEPSGETPTSSGDHQES